MSSGALVIEQPVYIPLERIAAPMPVMMAIFAGVGSSVFSYFSFKGSILKDASALLFFSNNC